MNALTVVKLGHFIFVDVTHLFLVFNPMGKFGVSWVRPETTFSYSIPFYSIKMLSIRP